MISNFISKAIHNPSAGVIRKMFEEGARLKKQFGEDAVFDFSLGNPSIAVPSEVRQAIKKVSADESETAHSYMPNAGYDFVRDEMAKKTALEQGTEISGKNIVLSSGAAGALNCVLKALINAGDEVIVPTPYFTEYDYYIGNHGGLIHRVPTKENFSLDIKKIENALSQKTCAILINSPNNPSGRIYSEDEIRELSKMLEANEKKIGRLPFLISDEPYRAIVYGAKKVSPIFPFYKNAVVVTSFAKNLSLPGERIGYLAVNPASSEGDELVAACIFANRILGFVNAPAFFQKVVAFSWNIKVDYSPYEKNLQSLKIILNECGFAFAEPDGAFYLFVKVPTVFGNDDLAFCDFLKQFNILCAPGSSFGCAGYFRIAYCVKHKTIENARSAFLKAMNSLKQSQGDAK